MLNLTLAIDTRVSDFCAATLDSQIYQTNFHRSQFHDLLLNKSIGIRDL